MNISIFSSCGNRLGTFLQGIWAGLLSSCGMVGLSGSGIKGVDVEGLVGARGYQVIGI